MARVAVVSGGTRGIGAAISKALNAAGYKVAANYAGNDEAASKFSAETGIKGMGKRQPIAANSKPDGSDDPEGRQKNRRVEVDIDTCS